MKKRRAWKRIEEEDLIIQRMIGSFWSEMGIMSVGGKVTRPGLEFGQTGISTSKGNTKVRIGFRNRIIGGRRIWWRILQVMFRKPREERSTRSQQCQILPKIPSQ